MRTLIALAGFTALLLSSGCGRIQSNVTVFHELPATVQGVSYAFIRSKEQQESLEHKVYEGFVRQQLNKRGFRETEVAQAELAVFLSYEIDNGREVVSSYPIFGQTGVSSSYTYGNLYRSYGGYSSYSGTTTYTPTYGVVGTGTASDTVFTRRVQLDMLQRAALDQGQTKKVYEGRVASSGASSQINVVMPYLIQALFEEFPGSSGTTRRVNSSKSA